MADIIEKIYSPDWNLLPLVFTLMFKIGFIVTFCVVAGRFFPKWKMPIRFVAFILLMRIALFQNPAAWYIYVHTLLPEEIGWRQNSFLYNQLLQYKNHGSIDFLAVGSSQTQAIYQFNGSEPENFAITSLAGFGPLDFYLYRRHILNYEPETILLYLSDFDLGRKPSLNAAKLSPSQGLDFLDAYFSLKEFFPEEESQFILKELLVGEFFPEYKYSFIFRGYVDKLFGKTEIWPLEFTQHTQEEYKQVQFANLKSSLEVENIEINMYYLEKFINFFEKRNIVIVILEGQYHPDAYTEKNMVVHKKSLDRLHELETVFSNVTYIPKSKFRSFGAGDFEDVYHVSREAGIEFTKSIFPLLNSSSEVIYN